MVSFTKNRKTSGLWHPDFRDHSKLPDISVIRTSFLMNFASAVVVASLFVYAAFNEISAAGLRSQIAELDQSISSRGKQNREYIKQGKDFEQSAWLVKDFKRFYKKSISPDEILLELALKRPKGMVMDEAALSLVQKRNKAGKNEEYFQQRISGTIKGDYDEALKVVDAYTEALKESEKLKDIIREVEVTSLKRDPVLALFTYIIEMKFTPQA